MALVNPVNQLHIADLIAENWGDIRQRLDRSEISEFRLLIQLGSRQRAISGIDFDRIQRRKIAILARYGRYIQTDIVRFFPSVPLRTIVWGLLGREWVQQHQDSAELRRSYATSLADAVRAGQGGLDTGIPVGPDASRILSEIVATEIEQVVRQELPDLDERSVRYVDDMLIGVADDESPEAVAAHLGSALYEFDLQLNDEKTAIHGVGSPSSPDWLHFVRRFEVSEHRRQQREDIDSFFEQSIRLADEHPRKDVLLFAAKRATTFSIDENNRNHFVRWLLYIARRAHSCLAFVAEYLAFRHRSGDLGPEQEVRRFIREQIPSRARAAHTSEVAWLLFWARETETHLNNAVLQDVVRLRSSVCALLLLDLMNRGLTEGEIDVSYWHSFARSEGLASEMWLVAYEASHKQWWPSPTSRSFLRHHPFFSDLFNREITFYQPSAVARREGMGRLFSSINVPTDLTYLQE